MKSVKVPWMSWYGNTQIELTFPENWDLIVSRMKDAPDISDSEIRRAFENPIGTARISELAVGKESVAIAVDDLTRPTQAYRLMPHILEELRSGGIKEENIQIILAIGAHRPMMRADAIKKLGAEIVDRFSVVNHHPHENLVYLGQTNRGTPVKVNKFFASADLKIGIGFISIHPLAGFGGGGKIILPGVCGIDVLERNHTPAMAGKTGGVAIIEGNEHRADIEEAARIAGLDVIVNTVGNSVGQTAGVFVGDLVDAHRAAVQLAQQVYATKIPQNMDIGVFNSFPKDTDFVQAVNATNVWSNRDEALVKEGGAIVVTTACPEGRGYHCLADRGMRLHWRIETRAGFREILQNRKLIFFCPNINYADLYEHYSKGTLLFRKWEDVVEELSKHYGAGSKVAVFPCSTLQFDERRLVKRET
jgi:nickel-dependent lactate racemase